MSGIERLRAIAGAWDEWGLGGALADIADEIERERAEDCYRMGFDCGTVWRVVTDMERHCLGHEGMEDSPVARWARELREALGALHAPGFQKSRKVANSLTSHSDASDVSMSVYDLLPQEERDAIAWVREHGGIVYVRKEWHSRVPYDRHEARCQRLLDHIAECKTALGRRREIISKLGHRVSDLTTENAELRRRAIPEGMEWPRYESGEPVRIGDVVNDVEVRSVVFRDGGILLSDCTSVPGWGTWRSYKEPIKRPAVPAADGKPLESEQTVWDANGDELVVVALEDGGNTVTCRYADVGDGIPTHGMWSPSQLTHTKPESIDTWQRIEEDAGCTATKYNERRGTIFTTKQQVARDLVRRCKALAEKENGNE